MVLQNRDAKTMQERSDDLLDRMGIKDQRDRRPSELSGGQQQRVAVARALASRPKFVLADEPTANLDSGSTEALLDIMAKLNKEEKITFIFSTHDQRVIDRAKRIIKLVDGEIVSDEQP
jgi:putative ABC transport system ATP-binding protein